MAVATSELIGGKLGTWSLHRPSLHFGDTNAAGLVQNPRTSEAEETLIQAVGLQLPECEGAAWLERVVPPLAKRK